jgi:MFS family permease
MAWIGDRVPYLQRQVLARLLGSTVLGMMVGSWAGGVLTETMGWRAGFFAMAVLFALIGVALRLGRIGAGPRPPDRRQSLSRSDGDVFASTWARVLVSFVEGALVFGVLAFVPSYLHERFLLPLAEAGAVLASSASVVCCTAGSPAAVARLRLRSSRAPGRRPSCCCRVGDDDALGLGLPACLVSGRLHMLHNTLQTCATQLSATARGRSRCSCAPCSSANPAGWRAAWCIRKYSPAVCFSLAAPALLVLGTYFALPANATEDQRAAA